MKIISRLLISFITLSAISSNAALYDRGNGMIYDSTQNITWLQDANYARTSGYDTDGRMTWEQSNEWANSLTFAGYSDWRLSSAGLNGSNSPCGSMGPYFFSSCPGEFNGENDQSFNNTRSEIGHLFFELGNKARFSNTGIYKSSGYGVTSTTFFDSATNQSVGFHNLQNQDFWQAEVYGLDSSQAWYFSTEAGYQRFDAKTYLGYAWAVRDGDVAPAVPVPAASWLMGSGLIGLAGIARRKK